MKKQLIKNYEEFIEWNDYNRQYCYISYNSTPLPNSYPCILVSHEYEEPGSIRTHIMYEFVYLNDFNFKD